MTISKGRALCAVTALLAFIILPRAEAQTLRLNLVQLEEASDVVVVGRTVRSDSDWTADRSAILTKVVIQVEDPVTGQVIGEQVVTVPGGQVGEYLHEVSDMPFFTVDEEVALFLTQHETGGLIVTGGWQGKLEVVTDPVSGERKIQGASHLLDDEVKGFAKREGAPEAAQNRTTLSIEDFVTRVPKVQKR